MTLFGRILNGLFENLTLRQHNRRLTRKTNGFSKELTWLE
jgi:IS1 family transposase